MYLQKYAAKRGATVRGKWLKTVSKGISLIGICCFVGAPAVQAASGLYNANDLLGQFDRNGQPTFLQGNVGARGMAAPSATVLDSVHHRLFVAADRVLVYNLTDTNQMQSAYADNVIGQPDLGTMIYSLTTQNSLYSPQGLDYDAAHDRLFVADTANNRVLVYNLANGITDGMAAANVLGQSDFTTNTPGIGQNKLDRPWQVQFDATTNSLFVADNNNSRVMVYDLSSGVSNGMNASKVLGQPDFTSSTLHTDQSGTGSPGDIALDSTRHLLFVAGGLRVMVFDISSGITNNMDASYVVGQPDFTSSYQDADHFKEARSVTYDPATHYLYASDTSASRVLVFDTTTLSNGPSPIIVIGQSDFTSTSGGTTQNTLLAPSGVNIDGSNHRLYVSDYNNRRIMVFDTTTLSNGMSAVDVIGQRFMDGQPNYEGGRTYSHNIDVDSLRYPQGTTIDNVHHRMFIADAYWNRILVYNLDSSNILVDHHVDYVLGQPDFRADDTSQVTQNSLSNPISTAYDAVHDRLFTADSYNGRVLVYNLSSGITNGMNASYVIGQPDFTTGPGSFTATQNNFAQPSGVVYDATSGYLYVADVTANRILVFNVASGITNGMNASYVIGQPNFSAGTCAITQNGVTAPYGLALDTDHHRLFVANINRCNGSYASRVLMYDTSALANGMNASAVIGEPDFTSSHDAGIPTRDTVGYPTGLAYDPKSQYLFVSDNYNNRITVFDVTTVTNGEDALGVLGQQDFTSNNYDCRVNATDICDPEGVADHFDPINRRLYISDSYNDRVLIFAFAKLNTTIPDATTGTSYSASLQGYAQGTTSYNIISGSLPTGVTLDGTTGVLSGTPAQSGDSTFTISLSDDNGLAGTYKDVQTYTLHAVENGSDSPDNNSSEPLQPISSTDDNISSNQQKTADKLVNSNEGNATVPQGPLTNQLLDQNDEFTTSGTTLDVHQGDQLAYSLEENGETSTYRITVKEVSDDSVVLEFESHEGTITLHTGEQRTIPIGQGTFRIDARLNSIVNKVANITFKRTPAPVSKTDNSKPSATHPDNAPTGKHRSNWWYWMAGALVIVVMGVLYKATVHSRRSKL